MVLHAVRIKRLKSRPELKRDKYMKLKLLPAFALKGALTKSYNVQFRNQKRLLLQIIHGLTFASSYLVPLNLAEASG